MGQATTFQQAASHLQAVLHSPAHSQPLRARGICLAAQKHLQAAEMSASKCRSGRFRAEREVTSPAGLRHTRSPPIWDSTKGICSGGDNCDRLSRLLCREERGESGLPCNVNPRLFGIPALGSLA